jgi:heme exporter protein CcmD
MTEFLAMGGYGGYVWSSFALTAIILVFNVTSARRSHAAARLNVARRIQAMEDD